MSICIYKDAELTSPLSTGDGSNADTITVDGDTGGLFDHMLYLANKRSVLAASVDAQATQISVGSAIFSDGEFLMADSEVMRISGGGGTTTLTVQRGANGTTAAPHADAAPIHTACNRLISSICHV